MSCSYYNLALYLKPIQRDIDKAAMHDIAVLFFLQCIPKSRYKNKIVPKMSVLW